MKMVWFAASTALAALAASAAAAASEPVRPSAWPHAFTAAFSSSNGSKGLLASYAEAGAQAVYHDSGAYVTFPPARAATTAEARRGGSF